MCCDVFRRLMFVSGDRFVDWVLFSEQCSLCTRTSERGEGKKNGFITKFAQSLVKVPRSD